MRSVWAFLVAAVVVASSCTAPPAARSALDAFRPAGGSESRAVGTGSTPTARCRLPGPGEDFGYVHPEDVGVSLAALRRAIDGAGPRLASSLRIYRRGCLIGRTLGDAETVTDPVQLFSMTKSVVSMVVGRAVTLGHLGVDDALSEHLEGIGPPHGEITVRQLLTQTSGLRFAWANDLVASGRDSVADTLALPVVHEPGTHFEYAQTTTTLLLAAVGAAVGVDVQEFARTELFGPIGIEDTEWTWARDAAGHTHGYSWLEMSPIAVARLATLVLDGGSWEGIELLDRSYLSAMTAPSPANPGYGFLVGVNAGAWHRQSFGGDRIDHRRNLAAPPDTLIFSGFLDQYAFVVPSLDLVIVRTGLPGGLGWTHEMFRSLLPGIEGVGYDDPGPAPQEAEFSWDWETIIALPELLDVLSNG